jgi:uncharacterized protein YndB with AHSA1/START domain
MIGKDRAVSVSRRINAPQNVVFDVLADPARHVELDGSGMLRGAVNSTPITRVGDVFVMKMHNARLGDYEMDNRVVEFEQDRRIAWEPEPGRGHPRVGGGRLGHRWSFELASDGPGATTVTESYDCSRAPEREREGMDNGRVWLDAMTATLERLDGLCTGRAGD